MILLLLCQMPFFQIANLLLYITGQKEIEAIIWTVQPLVPYHQH